MTPRPERALTRRKAARALERTGSSGVPEVDEILAAATAPATGFELNREAETVAHFRFVAAQKAIAPKSGFLRAGRSRFVPARAAIAAGMATLLAGGGVAFAASTGHLPEVLGGDHRSPTGAAHSSQAPGQQETNRPKPTAEASSTPKGTPSPSLKGLCRAFQAGVATNPGKALSNPAFSALAAAAGGKAEMAAFCADLIGPPAPKPTPQSTPAPTTKPTHPAHPTKTPNPNKPTTSPRAKSSSSSS